MAFYKWKMGFITPLSHDPLRLTAVSRLPLNRGYDPLPPQSGVLPLNRGGDCYGVAHQKISPLAKGEPTRSDGGGHPNYSFAAFSAALNSLIASWIITSVVR